MKIGDIITKYCSDHGLSYRQYALQCGVTNGYISMLINGANPKTGKPLRPTVETYAKLAAGMGMDINELFNMMDDAPVSLAMPSGSPKPYAIYQITAHGEPDNAEESELISIYRDLNSIGQSVLIGTARGLAANPVMKRGSESNDETTA